MLQFDDDIDNINEDLDNGLEEIDGQLDVDLSTIIPPEITKVEIPLSEEDESDVQKEIQKGSDITFGGLSCDDCSGSCSAVCASTCASTCTSSYSN